MRLLISFLAVVSLISLPLRGQPLCDFGSAALTLDSGNAVASVTNNGSLFRAYPANLPFFEVPKGSGIEAAWIAKVWVGGLINGEFHFTGSGSGREYFPGPLKENPLGSANCASLDRIYKVTRSDLRDFYQANRISEDMAEWPFSLGAPVVDGNGIINDYKPATGDVPELVGEEAAWWIMNDGGTGYPRRGMPQVGLEARVFAAAMPTRLGLEILFFRFTFTFVGPEPLTDAYVGVFLEPDLGDPGEYSVASDSARSSGFIYRKENFAPRYGENPPVLAVTLLKGPLVDNDGLDNDGDGDIDENEERLDVTALITADGQQKDYTRYYYHHLQGLCGDSGLPIKAGAGCYSGTGPPTKFWYSGDPITGTGWLDDRTQWIRSFVMPSGPFDWHPGEEQTIEFAVIWARFEDHFDSLERARSIAEGLRESPEYFAPNVSVEIPEEITPNSVGFDLVYPNPADEYGVLRYVVADPAEVTVELYDVLGRPIRTVLQTVKDPGWYTETIDVSTMPSGVYFYRISIGRLSATKPMTVVH